MVILKCKHHGQFNCIFDAFGALSLHIAMSAFDIENQSAAATLIGDIIWLAVASVPDNEIYTATFLVL